MTESQKASVAELFSKRGPERSVDSSRKLRVNMLIARGEKEFPHYEPYEESSWWGHRGESFPDSRINRASDRIKQGLGFRTNPSSKRPN